MSRVRKANVPPPAPAIETVELFPARSLVTQHEPSMPEAFTRCLDALAELASAGAMADLDTLQQLVTRTYLPAAVAVARDHGTPWSEIGRQLNSSRQAAQQRFR